MIKAKGKTTAGSLSRLTHQRLHLEFAREIRGYFQGTSTGIQEN